MAFVGSILANGQLPAVKATLYTVPALTNTYIKFINAHNPSAGIESVIFYIKKSAGVSRILGIAELDENQQTRVIDKEETLNLSAGDQIEGETTTVTTVDYVITGVEET